MTIKGVLLGVFVAFSGFGCAASYEPAASPRIAVTGNAGIVKNGKHYGSLLFGAPEAVKGNAQAEDQATTGRNMTIGGIVFGLAGVGAGTGALLANEHNQDLAIGLLVAELVTFGTSLVLIRDGQIHSQNAVNIYNDGISP